MIKSRTRNDVLITPTLQYLKIEQMAKELVGETNRRNQNKIRHNKHLELKGMSYKFESASIFPPNLKELGEKCFNEKKVSQDNMMRYLWAESCENARINKFVHKSAVRYSLLFIRMCGMVRDKVKNRMYDF